MKYLIIFTLLISCSPILDSKLRKASEARCLAPSANYYALGARHGLSTYNAATKILKYGITRHIDLSDKCRHTKILFDALFFASDGETRSWSSTTSSISGKIKVIKTHFYSNPDSPNKFYQGCRDYISYLTPKKKTYATKWRACPNRVKNIHDDKLGMHIGDKYHGYNVAFGGWFFYEMKYIESQYQ